MKLALVFLLCVVSVWSSPRFKRQLFGDVNLKTVPAVMKNPDAVKAHCNCMMADIKEAAVICDRMGNRLREQFPRLIERGDCPEGCTPEERKTSAFIVETLRDKYPECWFRAVSHFNITTAQLKKVETFLETVKTLPAK